MGQARDRSTIAVRASPRGDDATPSRASSGPSTRVTRVRLWPVSLLAVCVLAGCRCRGEHDSASSPPAAASSTTESVDLELRRDTLLAFGNAIPLPLSPEFDQDVPALRPPLARAAAAHPNTPVAIRVARDVPYGQLTRLMQAGIGFRVTRWTLLGTDVGGAPRTVTVSGPGPLPSSRCFARIWIAPDGAAHVGYDTGSDADAPMTDVVVRAANGAPQVDKVVGTLHRLDARCDKGELRVYTQPSAPFGPLFDVAFAIDAASPRPHVSQLMAAVPSLGPLDTPRELVH